MENRRIRRSSSLKSHSGSPIDVVSLDIEGSRRYASLGLPYGIRTLCWDHAIALIRYTSIVPHLPITLHPETPTPQDQSAIRAINQAAFHRPDEANLVDRLRAASHILLSLLATSAAQPVGHILFTRMFIETPETKIPAVALAPLAVLPTHQRQGIGGQLIQRGLDLLRAQGESIIIVLGHRTYYPRFGFSRDKAASLESPYPPESLMALELTPGALTNVRGVLRYAPPFTELSVEGPPPTQ
jgi:putative acetyltransferase